MHWMLLAKEKKYYILQRGSAKSNLKPNPSSIHILAYLSYKS